MARVLVVGSGGRAASLARELSARGHAVSETAPNLATIVAALDGVTIACLLGVEHLETLLAKMIDTTVRGVLYQGEDAIALRALCSRSHIPHVVLENSPAEEGVWLASAVAGVEDLLS